MGWRHWFLKRFHEEPIAPLGHKKFQARLGWLITNHADRGQMSKLTDSELSGKKLPENDKLYLVCVPVCVYDCVPVCEFVSVCDCAPGCAWDCVSESVSVWLCNYASLCISVHLYVTVYLCMTVHLYLCVSVSVTMPVCMYVCVWLYICVCYEYVCAYLCLCVSVCEWVTVHLCLCVYMSVCGWVWTCLVYTACPRDGGLWENTNLSLSDQVWLLGNSDQLIISSSPFLTNEELAEGSVQIIPLASIYLPIP